MDKRELKGFLKGFGVALILSAAIFYLMVINLRMDYEAQLEGMAPLVETSSSPAVELTTAAE